MNETRHHAVVLTGNEWRRRLRLARTGRFVHDAH